MPGIQPPDTPIEALTARLGDRAKPDRELARARLEAIRDLMLEQGLHATAALTALGLTWRTPHEWRTRHPDLWEELQGIRDTYADSIADRADDDVDRGLADVKASEPKIGSALASLWRERISVRRWTAERTARKRWGEQVQAPQQVSHLAVVMLPPLTPAGITNMMPPQQLGDGAAGAVEADWTVLADATSESKQAQVDVPRETLPAK